MQPRPLGIASGARVLGSKLSEGGSRGLLSLLEAGVPLLAQCQLPGEGGASSHSPFARAG